MPALGLPVLLDDGCSELRVLRKALPGVAPGPTAYGLRLVGFVDCVVCYMGNPLNVCDKYQVDVVVLFLLAKIVPIWRYWLACKSPVSLHVFAQPIDEDPELAFLLRSVHLTLPAQDRALSRVSFLTLGEHAPLQYAH